MFGLTEAATVDYSQEQYQLEDYQSGNPRWCTGCGDNAILTSVQRLCRDEQIPPEKAVFVSRIGCSSRFPHYMGTYGFHSLHGRALPIAQGVKLRRPDLKVFVNMGDGDCCSIGTAPFVQENALLVDRQWQRTLRVCSVLTLEAKNVKLLACYVPEDLMWLFRQPIMKAPNRAELLPSFH